MSNLPNTPSPDESDALNIQAKSLSVNSMDMSLDIDANRRSKKYAFSEIARRVLWGLMKPLFRYSPRPCFAWRRFLLRCMGAKVGQHVHIYPSATIYYPWMLEIGDWSSIGEDVLVYSLGKVTIGSRTTVSHRSHLCAGTHDYRFANLPLVRHPITVGNQVWICTESFIGPNITIHDGAIVGARAVVTKDVNAWFIVAGNPAKKIKIRSIPIETIPVSIR